MDRHDRSSEHEGRTCGASKRAYRQGARRPGLESALRRAWRNALGNLAGRDQGIPRQRGSAASSRSEEHTSELQSPDHLVCRLLLEKKKKWQVSKSTTACSLLSSLRTNPRSDP